MSIEDQIRYTQDIRRAALKQGKSVLQPLDKRGNINHAAEPLIFNSREDALQIVRDLTGGLGADVAIEAVGVPATFELAAQLARPGGHIALNYRTWTGSDAILWPVGKVVRASFRIPGLGARFHVPRRFAQCEESAVQCGFLKIMPMLGRHVENRVIAR